MTRTMVVSGASSGIGEAVARDAVGNGWQVIGVARRAERLKVLEADLGPAFRGVTADVSRPDTLADCVVPEVEACDPVTALVNCAGLSVGFGAFQQGSIESWDLMIDTNVRGVLALTRTVLPFMPWHEDAGIVNIGSIAGRYAYHGGNVYGATKAFVHLLSDSLRVDLEGTGIRVACVAPGMTRTEFALTRFEGDAERADALYQGLDPLQAGDVASAVLFVLDAPPRMNVNYIEMMPTSQRFGLALGPAERQERE